MISMRATMRRSGGSRISLDTCFRFAHETSPFLPFMPFSKEKKRNGKIKRRKNRFEKATIISLISVFPPRAGDGNSEPSESPRKCGNLQSKVRNTDEIIIPVHN